MSVTPIAGVNSTVPVGGTAVVAIAANPNGGVITNPYDASEPLYVDPVGNAALAASGTTFALYAGQSWTVVPGQTTVTTVNAVTNGHAFSVFSY